MSAIGKAEDRVIDVATIGIFVAGGYLLYKFLPELTETTDLTKKALDKAGEVAGKSWTVIEDSLDGDFTQATQDLYKVPVIGKVAVAVDKLFGSYREPPEPSYATLVRQDIGTYVPRMGELEKFEDWKPEYIQGRVDFFIKQGTVGNLYNILRLHQNHLAAGVLKSRGSIARMKFVDANQYNENGNAFKIGVLTKDNYLVFVTDYNYDEFLIGFAYYAWKVLGNDWMLFQKRDQIVQILNDVKFRNTYTVATDLSGQPDSITMGELRFLNNYKIDVKAGDDGFLKFSLGDVWA